MITIIYICIKCGHKIAYHTDTRRTKAPEECYKCSGKRFKKE